MSPWIFSLVALLTGTVLLYGGALWLIRGATALAGSLGVAPAVVGLTVVAFGTSLPELVVSVTAALGGNPDIALGNVVGSNIANMGLILGVACAVRSLSVEDTLVRREVPMGLAAVGLAVVLSADGVLGRLDGAILLAGFAGFLYWSIRVQRGPAPAEADPGAAGGTSDHRRGLHLRSVAFGIVGVLVGGHLLVKGGVTIAGLLGVPPVVVGLTVVAVGTSLPELAASLMATMKGQDDLGVGNVLGSNLFNLLGVLGVTAMLHPIVVPQGFFRFQYPVLAGFTLALFPICRTGGGISRTEGVGLLVAYGVYVGTLYLAPGIG